MGSSNRENELNTTRNPDRAGVLPTRGCPSHPAAMVGAARSLHEGSRAMLEQLQPTQAQRRMMEESRERQARYTAEHAGLATPKQMAEMNQADKQWKDMHDENRN